MQQRQLGWLRKQRLRGASYRRSELGSRLRLRRNLPPARLGNGVYGLLDHPVCKHNIECSSNCINVNRVAVVHVIVNRGHCIG